MFYIYVYLNTINNKVYIGQTNNLVKRDQAHVFNQHNTYIDNAIRKYGRSNFDYWTITICDTIEQANQEEIYWIAEMRYQLGVNNVYNISDGGEASMRGKKHSLQTRQKMSETKRGSRNPHYGKGIKGFTNRGSFKPGQSGPKIHTGKTWKVINGKRVWLERPLSM